MAEDNTQPEDSEGEDRPQRRPVRKKAPPSEDSSASGAGTSSSESNSSASTGRKRSPGSAKKASAAQVGRSAMQQLSELAGRDTESVTGLRSTDDGWTVQVEVVESRRIPDSTDILALYEVEVDASGELVGYRRLHRYSRGSTSGEQHR